MKTIIIMFDSLNRRMLPNYGNSETIAPNFKRLGEKCVTFDNFYAGSLPCMPARREMHTGRYNFLHRSWSPLEPYDFSMPELLTSKGIHTHLVTDHYHYFEDGGATYHNRYKTWEFMRGQEGDPFIGQVKDPEYPPMDYINKNYHNTNFRQDLINRKAIDDFSKHPQSKVFKGGIDFIDLNKDEDNWLLQIEEFDPHEPFFADEQFRELYPHLYDGKHFDWPNYQRVIEPDDVVKHCNYEYKSLVSMCDYHLGKVLDKMDEYNLWEDTMLIVNTDHGFFLGEKQWWGKCRMPMYNEIVHTPFFLYDPRSKVSNKRRSALTQTIDIVPTILEFYNQEIPSSVEGKVLRETIINDKKVRDTALFGIHGGHVNITDGRYVYMRAMENEDNQPLYQYTLMPTNMRHFFTKEEFKSATLVKENHFSFCDIPLVKYKTDGISYLHEFGNKLFDLQNDPLQKHPISNKILEDEMIKKLKDKLKECEAPIEQYKRLGI